MYHSWCTLTIPNTELPPFLFFSAEMRIGKKLPARSDKKEDCAVTECADPSTKGQEGWKAVKGRASEKYKSGTEVSHKKSCLTERICF